MQKPKLKEVGSVEEAKTPRPPVEVPVEPVKPERVVTKTSDVKGKAMK